MCIRSSYTVPSASSASDDTLKRQSHAFSYNRPFGVTSGKASVKVSRKPGGLDCWLVRQCFVVLQMMRGELAEVVQV